MFSAHFGNEQWKTAPGPSFDEFSFTGTGAPIDVTSATLDMWYRSDMYVGSPSAVTSWPDLSGSGNDLTVVGNGTAPVVNTYGGNDFIETVNGDNQYFHATLNAAGNISGQSKLHVFLVARRPATNGNIFWWDKNPAAALNRDFSSNPSSTGGWQIHPGTPLSFNGAGFTVGTSRILEARIDFDLNDTTEVLVDYPGGPASVAGALSTFTANGEFYVGSAGLIGGAGDADDCQIAELIVYNGETLSAPDVTTVRNYLNTRYSLPI